MVAGALAIPARAMKCAPLLESPTSAATSPSHAAGLRPCRGRERTLSLVEQHKKINRILFIAAGGNRLAELDRIEWEVDFRGGLN